MNRIALFCLLNCLTISSYAMNRSKQSIAQRHVVVRDAVKTIGEWQRDREAIEQRNHPNAEKWSTDVLTRQRKVFDTFIAPEMEEAINAIPVWVLSGVQQKSMRFFINYPPCIQPLKNTSYFLKVEIGFIAKRLQTDKNNQRDL